jgi:hypothetical protein
MDKRKELIEILKGDKTYLPTFDTIDKILILFGVMDWVAVEDELPDKDGDYLINWDGTVIEAGYFVKQDLWHDYEVSSYNKVTHWMHLPKPPCA